MESALIESFRRHTGLRLEYRTRPLQRPTLYVSFQVTPGEKWSAIWRPDAKKLQCPTTENCADFCRVLAGRLCGKAHKAVVQDTYAEIGGRRQQGRRSWSLFETPEAVLHSDTPRQQQLGCLRNGKSRGGKGRSRRAFQNIFAALGVGRVDAFFAGK